LADFRQKLLELRWKDGRATKRSGSRPTSPKLPELLRKDVASLCGWLLRHACGYKLANDGHDTRAIQAYLRHCNIQNTTRYTALAPRRFKEFFRD
jgi:integrase